VKSEDFNKFVDTMLEVLGRGGFVAAYSNKPFLWDSKVNGEVPAIVALRERKDYVHSVVTVRFLLILL
jgi:hypothetical protein